MSRSSTLILLGVFAILAPFSGFPIAFRNLLAVIFGACVLGIGLAIRTRPSLIVEPETAGEKHPMPPKGVSPI